MRQPAIIANWKMYKTLTEAEEFLQRFPEALGHVSGIEMIICAPFVALASLSRQMEGTSLILGAQNMHWEKEGPFTGEISPLMLREVGVRYVILGHSERRKHFGEDDEIVNKKIKSAFSFGLSPILCVGESLEQRERGQTEAVLAQQVRKALHGLHPREEEMLSRLIVAYEPVWAIGTGKPAGGEDAERAAEVIRTALQDQVGRELPEKIRVLYGGSVNEENVTDFTTRPAIDGALVGGSSLKEQSFARMIQAVYHERRG